jgi:hypothetical protein
MNKFIINIVLSGILGGLFTYLSSIYEACPGYLNIVAFFWGLPLLYFIILYIAWSESDDAMLSFNKHAIMGNLITIIAMLITYILYCLGMGKLKLVLLQILILFSVMFFYLVFHLYEL